MNGLVNEKSIMDVWCFLRKNNTIPNETLDFMREASLEKLRGIEGKSCETCKWQGCIKETIEACTLNNVFRWWEPKEK